MVLSLGCVFRSFLFTLCALILFVGILIAILWPVVFKMIIHQNLVLSNSSEAFKAWKQTALPLYMDFYMFDWVNAEECMNNKNIKPEVVERGPYVFREIVTKANMTWNENFTITYRQKRDWYFVREKSVGDLSDEVTSVNVVAVTVMTLADKVNFFLAKLVKEIVSVFLQKSEKKLYTKKTVRELLFDGYEDGVLELIHEIEKIVKIPIPTKFGWFYPRNDSFTFDGHMSVHTGVDDIEKVGDFDRWNYVKKTKFFSGQCSMVHGSTGDIWPPNTGEKDKISIYATDMCSTIDLKSNRTMEIKDLTGTVFVGDERMFDNGTLFPETSCYCENNSCSEPAGVRDMAPCNNGAPAFMSYPHFYLADPSFGKAVVGMKPNKSRHEFELVIEKNTGIPLKVDARLQVNILLKKIPDIPFTENLTHTIFPAFWFHQHTEITEEMAQKLKLLTILPNYGFMAALSICALSILSILGGVVCSKKKCCDPKEPTENPPLIDDSIASTTESPNN